MKPPKTAPEPRSGCLNEVRSWRSEQWCLRLCAHTMKGLVSMKSGLRDRNNMPEAGGGQPVGGVVSMKSGLGDRNNTDS